MYKYFHLAFDLFLNNWRRMFLLIIQMVFLLFLTIDSFQQIINVVYPQTIFNKSNIHQIVYFQPNSSIFNIYSKYYGENLNTESDSYDCFSELNGLKSIENCYTLSGEDNKTILYASGYNMNLTLAPKMIKGKWITDATSSKLYVRCVTSNRNYNIGDILEFVDIDSKKAIELIITGIISDPYVEFSNSCSGANALTDILEFTNKQSLDSKGTLLWINYNDIPNVNNFNDFEEMFSVPTLYFQSARYLFFDESLTNEQMQNNLNLLNSNGEVFTSSVAESKKDESVENFKNNELPTLISVTIICFIGVCFTIAVCIGESRLNFNIYYLCGAYHSQNIKIAFLLAMLPVLISDFPFLIILPLASQFSLFGWTAMAVPSGWLCIALLNLLILSGAFLTSYICLHKNKLCGGTHYDNL